MSRIIKHLANVTEVLLGRTSPGRGVTVYPDDRFVVSFPRSGNTWTRFLIGNLVHAGTPVTFANLESVVPSIYIRPDRVLRSLARPRVLASHECFEPRYPKVVYIVRDPRDVAVSYYHHNIKLRNLPDNYPMDQFVPRFIAADVYAPIDRYGSWGDHVLSWLALREGQSRFLLLRYEDLLANAQLELAKAARFLDVPETPDRLARAIELSSAARMRELEKSQHNQWEQTSGTRQDTPFVRAAKSGGWRGVLPDRSVAEIETAWGGVMQRLGYELTRSAEEPSKRAATL